MSASNYFKCIVSNSIDGCSCESEHGSVISFQTTAPINIISLSVNDIQVLLSYRKGIPFPRIQSLIKSKKGGDCALLFDGPLVNITNYSAFRVSSSSGGACFLTKQESDVVILSGEDNICSNALSTEAASIFICYPPQTHPLSNPIAQ